MFEAPEAHWIAWMRTHIFHGKKEGQGSPPSFSVNANGRRSFLIEIQRNIAVE
jgi:hypothetical protein